MSERLELIKEKTFRGNRFDKRSVDWSDMNWLIKQAERAEELEETLKFYANRENHRPFHDFEQSTGLKQIVD